MTVYLANVGDDWEVFESGDLAVAWLDRVEREVKARREPFVSSGIYTKTVHQTLADSVEVAHIRQSLNG